MNLRMRAHEKFRLAVYLVYAASFSFF